MIHVQHATLGIWAIIYQLQRKFPQLVKSLVYAAEKYAPLTLSDIVSDKEGSITEMKPTATLPAVIEYWLPFLTKEGHRATLKLP
jgi:hypothetical protein